VNRGEVWWVEHPDTGRRPYLIMTRQAVIPLLRKITAVPATQQVRGIPSEVPLDEEDGMPAARVLNFDSMAVMPKGWFVSRSASSRLSGWSRPAGRCRWPWGAEAVSSPV
jgi:mRNA interferase MazF